MRTEFLRVRWPLTLAGIGGAGTIARIRPRNPRHDPDTRFASALIVTAFLAATARVSARRAGGRRPQHSERLTAPRSVARGPGEAPIHSRLHRLSHVRRRHRGSRGPRSDGRPVGHGDPPHARIRGRDLQFPGDFGVSRARAHRPVAVEGHRCVTGDGGARRASASPKVREYMMPMAQDLPHDVAVEADGKVVITGMFSHKMYRLDPASGVLQTFDIPLERANPRAVELDERGAWWVLFGAPRRIARRDPATGTWTTARDRDVSAQHRRRPGGPCVVQRSLHAGSGAARIRRSGDGCGDAAHVPPHPGLAKVAGGPIPYELRIAPDGAVWISELGGDRLVRHDPAADRFRTFAMPTPHSGPRRFDFDAQGVLWIPEYAGGKLAVSIPRPVGSPSGICRSKTPRPMSCGSTIVAATSGSGPARPTRCSASIRGRRGSRPTRSPRAEHSSGTSIWTSAPARCGPRTGRVQGFRRASRGSSADSHGT